MSARNREAAVGVVGPGRVGQALGRLLAEAGVPITWVAARSLPAARKAARFIGAGRPVALDSPQLAQARILLLTTSDAALPRVAEALARRGAGGRRRVAIHTSGAWAGGGPESPLQALRRRGWATGSLHPFQTVPNPKTGVRNLRGCYWAVEGDGAAVRLGRRWVRLLHGTPIRIRPGSKPAYHAAGFLTCPGLVTLMEIAQRLLERSGVPARQARKMLGGFVAETVRNFEDFGARRALTGPAVRGDWVTLRKHVAALQRRAPEALPLYRELVRAMLKLAGKHPPSGVLPGL